MDEKARNIPYETYDVTFGLEERKLLQRKGAFTLPEKNVRDQLLRTYFDCVHPSFPILDRPEFIRLNVNNHLSLLILQSVYFVAATHCEESLILEAGFRTRHSARLTFYKRAKALYDADYEANTVTIVQALFLMSFWWGGPIDQKDTWHWLGAAIGLAQTKGMHRSTVRSDMCHSDQRLWKRIWWSLYVRDRHAAAALGRPMHIHDDDCDVEMLEESDFEEGISPHPTICGGATRDHILYVIQMAKLAVLLGNIIKTEFAARKSSTIKGDTAALEKELSLWEDQLPPEMRHQELGSGMGREFWANMLHMAYNNYLILLHRPTYAKTIASPGDGSEEIAVIASSRITRMIEDLLTAGTLRCGQLHLVPSLFAALSIHIISIQRSDHVLRKLTEHRARLCMLGLSELQRSWPVGGWILQLFVRIMEKLAAQGARQKPSDPSGSKRSLPVSDPESAKRVRLGSKPGVSNTIEELQSQEDESLTFGGGAWTNSSFGLYDSNSLISYNDLLTQGDLIDPGDFYWDSFGPDFAAQLPF
ncbi:MAG: hypothetical protein M1830_003011 [Pleopsidium flavum]|nr:MAG: hypothetical protein M1830_003011 [Pleopsidium flavum]